MLFINDKTVKYLGDSNLRRLACFVEQMDYFEHVKYGKLVPYFQLAVDGQTIVQLNNRVKKMKNPALSYSLSKEVIVMIGTNDILRGYKPTVMKRNLKLLLHHIRALGVENVRLCTLPPLPRANDDQAKILNYFNTYVRSLATAPKFEYVTVVDVNSVIWEEKMLERDELHINQAGMISIKELFDDLLL